MFNLALENSQVYIKNSVDLCVPQFNIDSKSTMMMALHVSRHTFLNIVETVISLRLNNFRAKLYGINCVFYSAFHSKYVSSTLFIQ